MKFRTRVVAFALSALTLFSLAACGQSGRATLLAGPASAEPRAERAEQREEYATLVAASNRFAARFAPAAVALKGDGNTALSPVSVYMALALSAQCASGETAEELYAALGVPRETVQAEFSDFYRGLTARYDNGAGKETGRVELTNSVWVQEGTATNADCVQTLAEKYFCYSYSADFGKDNAAANAAVRNFVKERTGGLIDKDFEFSESTLFTLINTLYIKDIWNQTGDELPLTKTEYDFAEAGGSTARAKLMQGYYAAGRAAEADTFRTFFAQTENGYKLHFLVPKEGHTAREIFTAENIAALMNADYRAEDEANMTRYHTRCLFPAFEAEFDEEVNEILKSMGVARFFRDPGIFIGNGCEFETLTAEGVYCKKAEHVAKLKVERRGIEGAAVTAVQMDAATAPDPGEWTDVYEEFVVDRAFGFVLTDRYGTILFSGLINHL